MSDDWELLRQFATDGSQIAFAELVSRHMDMVYSVAVRESGNSHAAQDIAQATFIVLAKKSATLRPKRALAGWLFVTARLVAADARKHEARRRHYEQKAAMEHTEQIQAIDDAADWEKISPLLNGAVARLGKPDRDTLILRFFEDKSHGEIAQILGVSEDAAKMRLSRALQKLRAKLSANGIQLSATALAGSLASRALLGRRQQRKPSRAAPESSTLQAK